MIEAVPQSTFSNRYNLVQPHGTVAELQVSGWKEKSEFATVEGQFRLYREGFLSGDFVLEWQGQILCRATKPSAFRAWFEVQIGGRAFTVLREGFGSAFVVREGARDVGSVRRAGLFTRRARIDLPDYLPIPAQVFVFWLVLVIWARDSKSA